MASRIFRRAALDRLSSLEQLDQLVCITGPQEWVALGVFLVIVAAAILWGWFAAIPVEVAGDGFLQQSHSEMLSRTPSQTEDLEAILFLSPHLRTKISAGMEAHIVQGSTTSGEPCFIMGEVRNVDLMHRDGDVWTRVTVTLKRDPNAPLRYYWISSSRFEWNISNGARVSGRIIVHHDRPLGLLIPGLRG
jgi:hypothetical protein